MAYSQKEKDKIFDLKFTEVNTEFNCSIIIDVKHEKKEYNKIIELAKKSFIAYLKRTND